MASFQRKLERGFSCFKYFINACYSIYFFNTKNTTIRVFNLAGQCLIFVKSDISVIPLPYFLPRHPINKQNFNIFLLQYHLGAGCLSPLFDKNKTMDQVFILNNKSDKKGRPTYRFITDLKAISSLGTFTVYDGIKHK